MIGILVIEITGIELRKPKGGEFNGTKKVVELLKRNALAYEDEKTFKRKGKSNLYYYESDFCQDPISIIMDHRTVFGPAFNIAYEKSLDLNKIELVELSACFKQLENTLKKASFVFS
ncbi:MAG: hypothetical protein IH948_05765 [Bacteroidetes bacterium]|nr:hypothetical protein [Bacteroidota bacterium]